MSKDILGRRRVARAEVELDDAVRGVVAGAAPLTRQQLRAFGRGVPAAVEEMAAGVRVMALPGRLEETAWALAGAVADWCAAERRRAQHGFAVALLRLESALKALQVARRMAGL